MFLHIYPNWGAEVCGVRINNLEGDLQADTPLFRVGGIHYKVHRGFPDNTGCNRGMAHSDGPAPPASRSSGL